MTDADILTELYEVIKQNKREEYAAVIEKRAAYPYLYHLSQIRENLIGFLPLGRGMRVLECNPECGALTGKLLAMAGGVTALAESELQEKILRERFKEPQEREKLDIRRQLPEHGRFDAILIVPAVTFALPAQQVKRMTAGKSSFRRYGSCLRREESFTWRTPTGSG